MCSIVLCLLQAQGGSVVRLGATPPSGEIVSLADGVDVFGRASNIVDWTSAGATLLDVLTTVDQIGAVARYQDTIVVYCGRSEYQSSQLLGEWFDIGSVAVDKNGVPTLLNRRTLRFETTTYRGQLNLLLSRLKNDFPTCEIVLVTPVAESGPDVENSVGNRLGCYAAAVCEAGNVWAVTVVDLAGATPVVMSAAEGLFRSSPDGTNRPPVCVKGSTVGCSLDSRREQSACSIGVSFFSDAVGGFSLTVM